MSLWNVFEGEFNLFMLHSTFAHLICFRKILFCVKLLKIFVSSGKLRCLHQLKFYKLQWKAHKSDTHSNDRYLDICLTVLMTNLRRYASWSVFHFVKDLNPLTAKGIPSLQNCIYSIINEQFLSYWMLLIILSLILKCSL